MPYIDGPGRLKFQPFLDKLLADLDYYGITPGELNYLFTILSIQYVKRKGKSYTHMNDVIGALEGAKLEFYRRMVAPYEDEKIEENGDVY